MTINLPIISTTGPSGVTGPSAPPTSAGCKSKSSCGASGPIADPEIAARIAKHPCYSAEAHQYYARMHVAVAPSCNIQCNYCNRKYDCSNESRPGVTSTLLTPEEALAKVKHVASEIKQMSVLGIAGPGDPLANPKRTFRTLDMVSRECPDIKLCLSTNGLRLPEYADRIADLGVDHVTVTVNMIDPEVGARIYEWVGYRGKLYTGKDEVVTAMLQAQAAKFGAALAAGDQPPRERILSAFAPFEGDGPATELASCPFVGAATELKDPEHPASRIAREQKLALTAYFAELARAGGATEPELLALQLTLVFDGASAFAVVRGESTSATRATVETLLAAHGM